MRGGGRGRPTPTRDVGGYVERVILSRIETWHVDNWMIVDRNKTVVFA